MKLRNAIVVTAVAAFGLVGLTGCAGSEGASTYESATDLYRAVQENITTECYDNSGVGSLREDGGIHVECETRKQGQLQFYWYEGDFPLDQIKSDRCSSDPTEPVRDESDRVLYGGDWIGFWDQYNEVLVAELARGLGGTVLKC